MTEILLFTLNGIVVYFLADWILRRIEARRGEVLKQRQVVFFVIFLFLALTTFEVLQQLQSSLQW